MRLLVATQVKVVDIRQARGSVDVPPPPVALSDDAAQCAAAARAQVQAIIDEALGPRKKKYRDSQFEGPEALGRIENSGGDMSKWERPSAICRRPVVCDRFEADDIVQVMRAWS